jgi:hypothetical protein
VTHRRAVVLLAAAVSACCGSCGGAKATSKGSGAERLVVSPVPSTARSASGAHAAPSFARSHHLATIARRAMGPFAARSGDSGLAAWIVGADRGGGQDLVVVTLAADGAPLSDPRVIASVPQEATSMAVRPAGGTRGGWLVVWSALEDRGESLTLLGLTPDGAPRGSSADIQRTSDHIKWIEVLPAPHGSLCVWAEEMPTGDANVLTALVDPDGKPHGMPVRAAQGVERWQVVGPGDGAGLALVTRGTRNEPKGAGTLSWARLDEAGHPLGSAIPVGSTPTVSSDVDVVAVPGGWLFAWTDRVGEDAHVMLAVVDAAGRVRGPKRAMNAVGDSSLVALASGPHGAALAWTDPTNRTRTARALHLAVVATEGELEAQPVISMEVAARVAPELVATDRGFALLASARTCAVGAAPTAQPACAGPWVPTFVRFGTRLEPVQTEPIFLGQGGAEAALAWGLSCTAERCGALAASGETPTPIFAVDLAARTSPFAAPTLPPPPPDAPRLMAMSTIASGQPFADVAATRLGDTTVVATLTVAPDALRQHGREAGRPRGASIALHAIDDEGRPRASADTLTSRALSVGGIAIASGAKADDGAAVAWVARDDHDPQVHVARVDRAGHRTNEVQLTTAKGDASSVAMAWVGDGWLVAWVDGRDGNGEVYATKIDRDLNRIAREERITNAPGDASDVALVARREIAWVAWSDPRESPRDGLGDIYATTLGTRDAKRLGDEVRVLATAPHSRSPQLAALEGGDGGAVLAWIEDAPTGLEGRGAAMVARLDGKAHVVGAPASVLSPALGRPTAIALAASGDVVRTVVACSTPEAVTLDALLLGADGTPATKPWPLLDLDAPPSFDLALALAGDAIFFDDVGVAQADHRVRRAAVAWRR